MATLGSAPPCSLLRLGRWAGGGMRRLATFPRLWRPCWREAPTATHRKYTHCKRHVKLSLSYPISYNNLSRQGRDLTKYEFKFKCYPKLNIFTILSEICRIPSLIFNKLFFRNLWDCWRNVFKGSTPSKEHRAYLLSFVDRRLFLYTHYWYRSSWTWLCFYPPCLLSQRVRTWCWQLNHWRSLSCQATQQLPPMTDRQAKIPTNTSFGR